MPSVAVASGEHLPQIKKLWRANSNTLGFFPDGAFQDHVERGWILTALKGDEVYGYLIYRVSRSYVTVVQLCVAPAARGTGIARLLMDHLKAKALKYDGVLIQCKREYDADKMWPRLGFVAIAEKPGRGQAGALLTRWMFSAASQPSLFTDLIEQITESRFLAVMDANVVFDRQDGHHESSGLTQGWFETEVALCVTDEILNEINRCTDAAVRQQQRTYISSLMMVPTDGTKAETIRNKLVPIIKPRASEADQSDCRQLAKAIAADAVFFITRDEGILHHAIQVEHDFGIRVVRPSDLITHLDRLLRAASYEPARLAGSGVNVRKATGADEQFLWDHFADSGAGEAKMGFVAAVRNACAFPQQCELRILETNSNDPLAVICLDRSVQNELRVPMLRVRRGRLARTIKRFLIAEIVSRSVEERRTFTVVTETRLDLETKETLAEHGFTTDAGRWGRVAARLVFPLNEIKAQLGTRCQTGSAQCQPFVSEAMNRIDKATTSDDDKLAVERALWPAKIADLDLPCYILPIQPRWAMHLLDPELADQVMFPALESLALNRENVYYRSARFRLQAPARLLWYISSQGRYEHVKRLRACSYLDEVVVGKPKPLFRRFEHLGIYGWPEIKKLARGNLDTEIMVLRFSGTELLSKPITHRKIGPILARHGLSQNNPFAGPLRIASSCFHELYAQGQDLPQGNASVSTIPPAICEADLRK